MSWANVTKVIFVRLYEGLMEAIAGWAKGSGAQVCTKYCTPPSQIQGPHTSS